MPRSVSERRRLRETFEEAPELYDRARPSYPEEVFDDLVAFAALPPGGRILEIGCGTGKATLPLARRGFEIVCIELGQGLAAVANRNLAPFSNVEVVNAPFERWETDSRFDAVVAFTAFHWIEPQTAYAKSARLLQDGGALAVVATKHVPLLDTYSGHRSIPGEQRKGLYARIAARIGDGSVRKTYVFLLNVAVRL